MYVSHGLKAERQARMKTMRRWFTIRRKGRPERISRLDALLAKIDRLNAMAANIGWSH